MEPLASNENRFATIDVNKQPTHSQEPKRCRLRHGRCRTTTDRRCQLIEQALQIGVIDPKVAVKIAEHFELGIGQSLCRFKAA